MTSFQIWTPISHGPAMGSDNLRPRTSIFGPSVWLRLSKRSFFSSVCNSHCEPISLSCLHFVLGNPDGYCWVILFLFHLLGGSGSQLQAGSLGSVCSFSLLQLPFTACESLLLFWYNASVPNARLAPGLLFLYFHSTM